MIAAGAYIRTLREEQQLSRPQVVKRMAKQLRYTVDPTTIWRIEAGITRDPHASLLTALVEAVGGDQQEVTRLRQNEHATEEDGAAAAMTWLRRDQIDRVDRIVNGTPVDDLAAVIEELRAEHQRNPDVLQHLRTFLAGWRGARSR